MKKLLLLLMVLPFLASCSSSDDNNDTPTPEHKNITKIIIDNKSLEYQTYVLAYKNGDVFKRLKSAFIRSNKKDSISIEDFTHTETYLFTDFNYFSMDGKTYWRRIDTIYNININSSNILEIPKLGLSNAIAVDISDNTLFPVD